MFSYSYHHCILGGLKMLFISGLPIGLFIFLTNIFVGPAELRKFSSCSRTKYFLLLYLIPKCHFSCVISGHAQKEGLTCVPVRRYMLAAVHNTIASYSASAHTGSSSFAGRCWSNLSHILSCFFGLLPVRCRYGVLFILLLFALAHTYCRYV